MKMDESGYFLMESFEDEYNDTCSSMREKNQAFYAHRFKTAFMFFPHIFKMRKILKCYKKIYDLLYMPSYEEYKSLVLDHELWQYDFLLKYNVDQIYNYIKSNSILQKIQGFCNI